MKRWLPFPLFSLTLLVTWLLASQSVSPGNLVLGAVVGVVTALTLNALELPRAVLRRPGTALRLAFNVLIEIARSNYSVARIVLGTSGRERRSGFANIPLETRNPYSLALLACIITATPGTVWVEYDSARNTMLLHVLDLIDEHEWAAIVKQRYEKPLMEIFG